MSGTFTVSFTSGGPTQLAGPIPIGSSIAMDGWYNDGLGLISNNGIISNSFQYENFLSSIAFVLDGVNSKSFNGLPAGFIVTAINLNLIANALTIGQGTLGIHSTVAIDIDSYSNSGETLSLSGIPLTIDPLTALNVISQRLGFSYSINSEVYIGAVFLMNKFASIPSFSLSGTYEIFQSKINVETPSSSVSIGDEISITTPPQPDSFDLSKVDDVTVQWIDSSGDIHSIDIPASGFTSQGQFLLIFIMPDFEDAVQISIFISGTTFSGFVPLGNFPTINFTNATGIYKLVPGQAYDTLYNQDNPPETINVKIPDPFAKTGFIGG